MNFPGSKNCRRAFTLVELLVATGILILILGVMFSMISQTSNVWRTSSARIEAFQSARRAFDTLTRTLEQATLNTYWDYDDPNNPVAYKRKSELHFLITASGTTGTPKIPGTPGAGQAIFFQAPLNRTATTGIAGYENLTGLINACGFYVEYGSDSAWLPPHAATQARERFRLMQWMQNTESLTVYGKAGNAWIASDAADVFPVADNVIALIIWPKEEGDPTTPVLNSYSYDSRSDARSSAINQLPPVLKIALVAIDETSAVRLGSALQTTVTTCMAGLFESPPIGSNPRDQFSEDIKTLGDRLTNKSINYRSFVTAVPMREAKWSP